MVRIAMMDGQGVNLWEVVLHSGPVAKVVLVVLAVFSVVSWVVIFQKAVLLKRSRGVTDRFRALFRRAKDWRELKAAAADYAASPLAGPVHRRLPGSDLPAAPGRARASGPRSRAWRPWSAPSSGPRWWRWAAWRTTWASWPPSPP